MACTFKFNDDTHRNIYLHVRAEKSPKVANQIFAELEEQIERTFLGSWVYRYLKPGNVLSLMSSLMFIIAIGASIGTLFSLSPPTQSPTHQNEAQHFLEKSKQANTTETKVDFLFEYQRRQLEKEQELANKPPENSLNFSKMINWRNFFILLPILLIVGCVLYVITKCYPRTNFLWGDYDTFYKELMAKKRVVWLVVIASLVLGIVGNLFVYGLSGYVKVG
jgi:hypothetical protein